MYLFTRFPPCPCRCMGWLIRFIHNRDLAAENIVTAYTRQRFVLAAPAEALGSLLPKLEAAGYTLPVRSLLNNAARIVAAKGGLAGEFKVEVPRNARKENDVDLTSHMYSSDLAKSAKELCKTFALGKPRLTQATALFSTIRINGRPYRQGDYVEFSLHVRRNQSSRAAMPETRGVGMIKTFYDIPCGGGGSVNLLPRHTFIALVELPSETSGKGMHVLRPQASGRITDRMVHVDNIVFKLRRVPQPLEPGEEDDGSRFFCLRIWEAR